MKDLTERRARCENVNGLIHFIADCGRRFFHSSEMYRKRSSNLPEYDSMEVDDRGRIWFVSQWDGKRVYTHHDGRWRGFHHGGTLRRLVEKFRDYIKTGAPMNLGYFGPFPSWMCGDCDAWGYGLDNMAAIREKAAALGVAKEPQELSNEPQ